MNKRKKERYICKQTLCWDCENAANGGCSWSDRLVPVEGWDADYKPVRITPTRILDSYMVNKCPEFVAERR